MTCLYPSCLHRSQAANPVGEGAMSTFLFPLFCVQSDHPFPPPAILEMGGKRRRRVVHVPFDAASRRRFRIGGGEKKEE